jgi:hypothetical protein
MPVAARKELIKKNRNTRNCRSARLQNFYQPRPYPLDNDRFQKPWYNRFDRTEENAKLAEDNKWDKEWDPYQHPQE